MNDATRKYQSDDEKKMQSERRKNARFVCEDCLTYIEGQTYEQKHRHLM